MALVDARCDVASLLSEISQTVAILHKGVRYVDDVIAKLKVTRQLHEKRNGETSAVVTCIKLKRGMRQQMQRVLALCRLEKKECAKLAKMGENGEKGMPKKGVHPTLPASLPSISSSSSPSPSPFESSLALPTSRQLAHNSKEGGVAEHEVERAKENYAAQLCGGCAPPSLSFSPSPSPTSPLLLSEEERDNLRAKTQKARVGRAVWTSLAHMLHAQRREAEATNRRLQAHTS
eukprot:CAMPEP_0113880484 /NCGR_PEP_ID=MMETSP0780_2-20120614/7813_1 /TAXON_ID=652834 /ORGANISM="Palpitomonas bilix" /LENGTH=232 /DNA_ID=CAMNT_0000867169 /DNA_START=187 /DNA_END=885 /DNA_ORIENTATION=- /assembly_acc=CAM_ASM_000599